MARSDDAHITAGSDSGTGRARGGGRHVWVRARTAARRGWRRLRRLTAAVTVQSLLASGLAPVTVVAATAAAVTAADIVSTAAPAKAAVPGSALILSTSVNGGTSSAEARAASALGLTVTVATPTTWDGMTTAQFKAYTVLVIGDPSTTTCSSTVPSDALSTAGKWGPAVTGQVAVLGTAPALAGATTLISKAIAYAASGSTGLYVSLNCEYSTAAAGTDVTLLDHVQGGGFTVTGQAAHCPSDAGTVNTWEALALAQFNGLTSADLGPWASPACSVEETFGAWPAGLGGVGYDTGASPATFTASDGATGQAYVLAGAPVAAATAALAPSLGGQVPAGATTGGGDNPAAPGVSQPTASGVNTANGDFTQSSADLSVPTFGPALGFTRTYDAQAAQQQTQTGTPGVLGYGWTSNWASSLSAARPVPGDIYTVDGLRANTGDGGPPGLATLNTPAAVIVSSGNVYIADTAGNRVLEVPATSGTFWGQPMTAGDIYTIAGSQVGTAGMSPSGTAAKQALISGPEGIAVDSAGNLYLSDASNSRVLEIPVTSGTQRGISMTAGDIYVIAGTGAAGTGGDRVAATSSSLSSPAGISVGPGTSDVYIADAGNNRIQEVAGTTGTEWGQSMTAGDVYTVAGSASGTGGNSGLGGAATSARLSLPVDVEFASTGDMYIAVMGSNHIVEVAKASGTQWGKSMTANDIYDVAGSSSGTAGTSGDGGAATSALLDAPAAVSVGSGPALYVADSVNNRVQEVAGTAHSEWGISMAANHVYTVAGSAAGRAGFSGDGGAATSALMNNVQAAAVGGGVMYVADANNGRVRQVSSAGVMNEYAGSGATMNQTGDGGPAVDAALYNPQGEVFDAAGDIYVADGQNNRIQEIAATSHTQYGIAMTAGDVYTIAGSADGFYGTSGDGGKATSAYLDLPESISMDPAGNLYIVDTDNCRVQEVNTAGIMSTVAGNAAGACGISGDGGPATSSYLGTPEGLLTDSHGDIYIADTFNSRIQEVFASGGLSWGKTMTAGDIYTIAGSATGGYGSSGDGGPAASALLHYPVAMGIDGAQNLYIADWSNNRIQEVASATGIQRGVPMTANDMYTIAGSATGTAGSSGDGGPATKALLNGPGNATVNEAGDLYVTDGSNNRIQEIPVADGTQWGQPMTANDIYTVAGSATGTAGNSGDGGRATAALFTGTQNVSLDPAGDIYITDGNNRLREVTSIAAPTITPAPGLTSPFYPSPGGLAITQPGGSQVTFYAQNGGACTAPYVLAGQYCTLPQDVGATLNYNSGTGIYTYTDTPGDTYTYNTGGNLTSQADQAGNTLTVAYGTPVPGSGHCPATANWCQAITAASGRALTVGYSAANLVTSVTDPLGRTWAYTYTGSDLTSVKDPMGNITSYTYGAGATGNPLNANNMLTVTKPNGQTGGPDAGAHTTIAYDSSGRVTSQTGPMGFTTSYTWTGFDPATGNGAITVAGPDGNKTVYYYTQGTLAAQSAWTGSTLTSERDYVPDQTATSGDPSAGTQLDTASADGNGNITTTTYDASGNPVTTTSPDGVGSQTATATQQSTSLDQPACISGQTASSTCTASPGPAPAAAGGVITPPASIPPLGVTWVQYDTNGNQLWTTTGVYPPGGSTASYASTSYQLFKNNSITLNGATITCATTPPSPSLPCAKINPDGVVTQLAYNTQGDLTSSSTPDGTGTQVATTTYTYDGDGEQTATTSPDGNLTGANAANYTTTTAYNADGQRTTVTKAGGTGATVTPRTTSYGYDPNGSQTTLTGARGYATTTTYNADDQATLVTDPDGNATLTCYDGAGHVTQTVPPAGVAAGSLTPASCPASYPAGYGTRLAADATTYTYDANGDRTQMTTPAPAGQTGAETTTYAYDTNGNLTQTTAPPTANGGSSQVTVDTYTSTGQLASETTGYGTTAAATVSYCYDPNGDKTSAVYPDGNVSAVAACETAFPWVVNATSYPTQASYQTTYSYDSAAELVSTTAPATTAAPSGATTTSTYDPAGNTLTRKDPNGITTTWTYTPLNLTASVSYSGNTAHPVTSSYDANGNKTGMTDATGTSSYTYDPFGELTSATNGAGQTTGYGYDADGNTTSIAYPLPATATWATTPTVTYGYDHAGLLASVTDFNGHAITITSTADGLPASAALGSTGDTITTSYDNTDAASSIALKNSASTLQSFAYTDAPAGNILSEADTPTSSQSPAVYTYDTKSRVTSMTPGTGATHTYTFDPSGNLTITPAGASASYDKAAELTSSTLAGTTTSYTYNAGGQRLTAIQGSTTTASGTWNGAGQLTAYSDSAASMTAATYDGTGLRAAATTTPAGGTAFTQGYVWDTVPRMPQMLMDGNSAYIYDGGLAPAQQVRLSDGTITYLVTDLLGSVRGTVNSSGALTGTTNYDAWGNPETTGGLTNATPFGFAGAYTDPSGLIYLVNRYYDSVTGQFISVDPSIAQTRQPYAYANDDPISQVDPAGNYGYTFNYNIGPSHRGASAVSRWVVNHFWVFPFWNVPSHLRIGQVVWLDYFAPVRVINIWPFGFALYSLPGHPEGAYKTIEFWFFKVSRTEVYMQVHAFGPNDTSCNRNPVCAAFNKYFLAWPLWEAFAFRIWWYTPSWLIY